MTRLNRRSRNTKCRHENKGTGVSKLVRLQDTVSFASLSGDPSHGSQRMVTDGSSFRVVAGDLRRPHVQTAPGSSRALEDFTGPKPRLSPDAAREIAQSSVTRLEKALEGMGDVQGPAVQGRNDESQGRIEATCGGGVNRPVSEVHRQVRKADQRVGHTACRGVCSQDGGPRASREVVGSAVPCSHHDANSGSRATSDLTSADGEYVASRTVRWRKSCTGRAATGRSVGGQETSSHEARGLVPVMPKHVPNDVMSWLQDPQADSQQAVQGDLMLVTELGKMISEGGAHLTEITTVQPSSVGNMVIS